MLSFSKEERLCSQVLIERLIKNGKSFNHFPIRLTWLPITESSSPIKVVISVPKRNFKKAVDRNRIKRQIREIYRIEKPKIYNKLGTKKILLIINYTSKTKSEFSEIQSKIIEALDRLIKLVS